MQGGESGTLGLEHHVCLRVLLKDGRRCFYFCGIRLSTSCFGICGLVSLTPVPPFSLISRRGDGRNQCWMHLEKPNHSGGEREKAMGFSLLSEVW